MGYLWRTQFRFLSVVLFILFSTSIAGTAIAQNSVPTAPNEHPVAQTQLTRDTSFRLDDDPILWQQATAEWAQTNPILGTVRSLLNDIDLAPPGEARLGVEGSATGLITNDDGQTQTGREALDQRDKIFYPGDTERLKPLGRKLALNIILDEKEFFTSPLHMNRRNAKWWLLSAAAVAALIGEDRRIANSLSNSRGQVVWGGRISQIGAPYTLLPVVVGYYGFGVLADHAKAREIGVLATEAAMDSLILVEVLKLATMRNRPDARTQAGDFWAGGDSFPSGHTIATWSLASLVVHEYKNRPLIAVIAYGLAATVGASRVAARQHFASDVFVGGAMGYFIGRYVYNTHMSHLAHKHASLMPMVVPQYQAATHSYGMTLLLGLPGGAPAVGEQ